VKWLLVGDDFRFGRPGVAGDLAYSEVGWRPKAGFDVEAMGAWRWPVRGFPAAAIRACLEKGDLDCARRLLGRRYCDFRKSGGRRKLGRRRLPDREWWH